SRDCRPCDAAAHACAASGTDRSLRRRTAGAHRARRCRRSRLAPPGACPNRPRREWAAGCGRDTCLTCLLPRPWRPPQTRRPAPNTSGGPHNLHRYIRGSRSAERCSARFNAGRSQKLRRPLACRLCGQRPGAFIALAVAPGPLQLAVGCALDPAATEIIVAPAPRVVELVAGDDAFELGDADAEVVPAAHGLCLALESHAEVELRLGIAPLADIVAVERLPRPRRDGGGRARAAELRDIRR